MSEVVLTVRGEQERKIAPERAIVRLSVRADGPERGPVIESVHAAVAPLREGLETHLRSGEVAEFSTGKVAVWSERPWNHEGLQLTAVHHASIEVIASFVDFSALSWWLGEIADTDEVQVEGVEWDLTPATRTVVEREAAAEAVRVAISRAEAYAEAIDRNTVVPTEIADVGLLTAGTESAPTARMMSMSTRAAAGSDFSLQPAEIVVRAAVEARFRAS